MDGLLHEKKAVPPVLAGCQRTATCQVLPWEPVIVASATELAYCICFRDALLSFMACLEGAYAYALGSRHFERPRLPYVP